MLEILFCAAVNFCILFVFFLFPFWLICYVLVSSVAILIGLSIKQDASRGQAEEDQSNVNLMCRLCLSGENEGSEKARRMLPCKKCGKKYHRSCLKSWAQHRGKIIYWLNISMKLQATHSLICGSWLQIYSTGVHGSVPLVGYVR